MIAGRASSILVVRCGTSPPEADMPLFDCRCASCDHVFEVLLRRADDESPRCPACGADDTRKLIGRPAIKVKAGDGAAVSRIEQRVKGQLIGGKFGEATRFADKAASMVKSDRVKKLADKLHQKTGK